MPVPAVIVLEAPSNEVALANQRTLTQRLGTLPPGVHQVALNVWLADEASFPNFLLLVQQKAAVLSQHIHCYTSASPKPDAVSPPTGLN